MSSVLPEYGNGKPDAPDAIMDTGEQDVAVDQPDEVFRQETREMLTSLASSSVENSSPDARQSTGTACVTSAALSLWQATRILFVGAAAVD